MFGNYGQLWLDSYLTWNCAQNLIEIIQVGQNHLQACVMYTKSWQETVYNGLSADIAFECTIYVNALPF